MLSRNVVSSSYAPLPGLGPLYPPLRHRTRETLSMPAARSHPPDSEELERKKTSTIKRYKYATLSCPYKTLYEQQYIKEFNETPSIEVPQDPRSPRLTLSDLECIRTMGISREEIFLANVKHRPHHKFSTGPFPVALKSYIRSRMRSEMIQLAPQENDTRSKVVKENSAYSFRAKHFRIHEEKIILVNMPWSPWVAGLYQTFHDEERIYMALEFIPGGTLRQLILKERYGLPLDTALFYYANIVLALEFLQNYEIVHCDLKPENILIGGDGYLVLTDFGAASQSCDPHPSDFVDEGTFFYRAPETLVLHEIEIHGKGFDQDLSSTTNPHAADWWSSGIILFELVTGKIPFDHSDADVQKILIHQGVYKWPSGFRVGQSLRDLLERLLERDPKRRLGAPYVEPVKCHPWFSTVDWDQMGHRRYSAPYVPEESNMTDTWASLPMPKQEYIPGLQIAEPPIHLANDNRFFKRPAWEIRRNLKNKAA